MISDRKAEILEVADEFIETVGYDSFSYNDLSERLGIRKASIHHHFATKEDLGLACCDMIEERLRGVFEKMDAQSLTAWDKLETIIQFGRKKCKSGDRVCPISSLQAEVNVLPERLRARHKQLEEFELAWYERVLAEGQSIGEMAFEGSPRDQAVMVAATIKGALQYARAHGMAYFDAAIGQLRKSLEP